MPIDKWIKGNVSILAFLFFIPFSFAYWRFKFDDAYISFVYAKNFINGNGLTYNGMVVEGYSNFLWTILISPFIGLGIDPLIPARIISILSVGVSLYIVEKLNYMLNPRISKGENLLSLMVVMVCAPVAAWTMGGLETVFMALWVVLFVYLEIRFSGYLPLVACLICALIRPEGIMIFAIAIAYRLFFKKEAFKTTLLSSLLVLIPYSSYIFWRYSYYGYLLPNTAYLKLNPSLEGAADAAVWLSTFFQLRPLFAILIFVSIILIFSSKEIWRREWSLVLMVSFSYILFILYSGKDWMPHHRFLVPVIFFSSLLIGKVFSHFNNNVIKKVFLITALGSLALEVLFAFTLYKTSTIMFGDITDGLARGGIWIRENTHPDDIVAIEDAGLLAYYGERKTIDVLGLNNEHIAHTDIRSDWDFVLSHNPKIIQIHIWFSSNGIIYPPSQGTNKSKLYEREEFLNSYEPYWEGAIDPFFPPFFLRK
jgi:arabinofuranosyltransferase